MSAMEHLFDAIDAMKPETVWACLFVVLLLTVAIDPWLNGAYDKDRE